MAVRKIISGGQTGAERAALEAARAGGVAMVNVQITEQSQRDVLLMEMIAIPLSFLVLVWVFGGLLVAAVPIAVGVTAILGALAVLHLITFATDVSIFALNLTAAMGLALAIDYTLLMVSRFRDELTEGAGRDDAPPPGEPLPLTAADQWILTRLSETIAATNRLMDAYQYGEAGRQIYDFLWSDFADWYLEAAKVQLDQGGTAAWVTLHTAYTVLDQALRLLHPYIPYVTEETWQQLNRALAEADLGIGPDAVAPALIIADWPEPGPQYPEIAARWEQVRALIRAIRAARAEHNVEPARYIPATIVAGEAAPFLESQRAQLVFLARLDDAALQIVAQAEAPEQAVTVAPGGLAAYLPLAGLVDLAQERRRLESELSAVESQIQRLTGLLNGPFAEKAPPPVVQQERDKLARFQAEKEALASRLSEL